VWEITAKGVYKVMTKPNIEDILTNFGSSVYSLATEMRGFDNKYPQVAEAKTQLLQLVDTATRESRIDEINRWFDMPKRYPGEEYRDEPFAKVKCKTPGRVQYYTLDNRFNYALSNRLDELTKEVA
jgi:hypothetical protein